MKEACQLGRYLWITREIYANVSTNVTYSWGFITTKKYWNTYRVYLMHRGKALEIVENHIWQLKEKDSKAYTPAQAWNGEPALFLFQEACSRTQQSESLPPAKSSPQPPHRTKHRLYMLFVRVSKYMLYLLFYRNFINSETRGGGGGITHHGPILQLHRKAYLHQTLCFYHRTPNHFSTSTIWFI